MYGRELWNRLYTNPFKFDIPSVISLTNFNHFSLLIFLEQQPLYRKVFFSSSGFKGTNKSIKSFKDMSVPVQDGLQEFQMEQV